MKVDWNYQDTIDLEYFLHCDAELLESRLQERDREIYLQYVATEEAADDNPPDSHLLRKWLDCRRKSLDPPVTLPGQIASEALSLTRFALIVLGCICGAGAGTLFLSYSGITPVNVLHFLVLFVFSQQLLAVIFLLRGSLWGIGIIAKPNSLVTRGIGRLIMRFVNTIQRRGRRQLSAAHCHALGAGLGRLKGFQARYGALAFWPIFLLVQLFGIFFNLGLLAATFLKIIVSDVAFGWQSTLQFSSASLHSFTKILAMPWSWLLPEGIAHPTLSEIEGSHIVLKEGISSLATVNLISWWPFLLLCVLVYGLLTRTLLYLLGSFRQRATTSSIKFNTPSDRQVIRRMLTPVVSTQAPPENTRNFQSNGSEHLQPTLPTAPQGPLTPIQLILPDELYDLCQGKTAADIMAQQGYAIASRHRFMVDYESDQQLLAKLGQTDWSESTSIVIIMEAWMPPLIDFLSFLKQLREQVGTELPILIRLVGKPSAGTIFTSIKEDDVSRVWQQKIDSLGDPYLHISALIKQDSA